ncbi:MAG: cell division protein FtsL [Rhodobacteraceae bacterium]|mgnify:FL=1|nr:MAG: cell division protein FtsL [Paracoccaceae bacterium]
MRMIILSVLSVLCILSAIWAYQVNYQTRSVKKDIQLLNDKIVAILNRIDLLEAEWAFLNRPKRLAKLVDDNFETLRLVPITKDHFQNSLTSYLNVVESKDGE